MADDPLFEKDLNELLPPGQSPKRKTRARPVAFASTPLEDAHARVSGPAIGLMVISAISAIVLLLSLAFDIWYVTSGTLEEDEAEKQALHAKLGRKPSGFSGETTVAIRVSWLLLMLANDAVIMLGAIRMHGLKNPTFSRIACILACIPCLGPCFVFGIPFGAWGLSVLGRPEVSESFERNGDTRE